MGESQNKRRWVGFSTDDPETTPRIDASRLAGFSDGVFAIAITLLVLSIPIPEHAAHLGEQLKNLIPEFGAYLLSFFVVGRFWIAHHSLLGTVSKPNPTLAMINVFYLASVVFIPFPTELVGRYGNEFPAFCLYAASLSVALLASLAVREYITRAGLLRDDAPRFRENDVFVATLFPIAVFLCSIPLALITGDTQYGFYSWGILVFVNPGVRVVGKRVVES